MSSRSLKVEDNNSVARVGFREKVQLVENGIKERIEEGSIPDTLEDCTLNHYFAPMSEEYGCTTYAREMTIPKGTVIVGKIHKHAHLNIISKGKVSVATEFGKKYFEAPCTFVSEVGLKRAVYAEEETVWTTIHLTKHEGEESLDKIEDEVIADDYGDLGLIASKAELDRIIGDTL